MNHIQSPATGDQAIEREIAAVGANKSPRVTLADIEAAIDGEYYFTAPDGIVRAAAMEMRESDVPDAHKKHLALLTFCVLVLKNGFTVTGESACASPENFNAAIGRKIARENAVGKVWSLMGYALKEKLAG